MARTNFLRFLSPLYIPLLLFGLTLIVLLPYAPPHYINRDSGIFFYAGREITLGKLLYLDVWDHKGPFIFYINALGLLLGNRAGVWALECVFLFVGVISGYAFMKNIFSANYAIMGTVAWLFSFFSLISGGNYTEEFSLPFSFLSFFFFYQYLKSQKKIYIFLIGLAMGFSLLFRPNNIGAQAAIALVILLQGMAKAERKQTVKNIFMLALGFLLVLIPTFAFFFQKGSLSELLNATFFYNYQYSTNGNFSKLATLQFFTVTLGWPFWCAIVGWFMVLKDALTKTDGLPKPILLLILIGFPLEIYLDTLSNRPYVHYVLIMLPYIGLLNAFVLSKLVRFLYRKQYPLIKIGLLATCFFAVAFSAWISVQFIRKVDSVSNQINENSAIIAFVKDNTSPKDGLLVWGQELSINFLAQRTAPTPFAFQTFFLDNGTVTPALEHQFISDIQNHKPVLVVITDALPFLDGDLAAFNAQLNQAPPEARHLFIAFSEFIHQNYHPMKTIEHFKIFKLNE